MLLHEYSLGVSRTLFEIAHGQWKSHQMPVLKTDMSTPTDRTSGVPCPGIRQIILITCKEIWCEKMRGSEGGWCRRYVYIASYTARMYKISRKKLEGLPYHILTYEIHVDTHLSASL
jgi:hypothetical protein